MSYNSKKEQTKDIYSPSSRKALTPNYYQKKGRTLQNSVGFIPNPNSEIITQDTLDRYYRTLLKFKYKFAGVESYPSPFNFFLRKTFYDMFRDNPVLNPDQTIAYYKYDAINLKADCMTVMATQYPQIATLYQWHFAITFLQFDTKEASQSFAQNILYSVDCLSMDQEHGVGLFQKDLNPPILPNQISAYSYLRPYDFIDGRVWAEFLKVKTDGEGRFTNNRLTVRMPDTNYHDNGDYPFMATDMPTDDPFNTQFILSYQSEYSDVSPNIAMNMVILAYPRPLHY